MIYEFSPIGYVHCREKNPYELPRQAVLAKGNSAIIELQKNNEMKMALQGLETFSHIWVIYLFHKNPNWTAMVQTPRSDEKKKGVFATRAPYRPNPIGMSCVPLVRVDRWSVHIGPHDLMDQTPVLDIKPYLPYADSFSQANTGWLTPLEPYKIILSEKAQKQIDWLEEQTSLAFQSAIYHQLSFEPLLGPRKRVYPTQDKNIFLFKYKTWRVLFKLNEERYEIEIYEIRSGYSIEELNQIEEDIFQDKFYHRLFNQLIKEEEF